MRGFLLLRTTNVGAKANKIIRFPSTPVSSSCVTAGDIIAAADGLTYIAKNRFFAFSATAAGVMVTRNRRRLRYLQKEIRSNDKKQPKMPFATVDEIRRRLASDFYGFGAVSEFNFRIPRNALSYVNTVMDKRNTMRPIQYDFFFIQYRGDHTRGKREITITEDGRSCGGY